VDDAERAAVVPDPSAAADALALLDALLLPPLEQLMRVPAMKHRDASRTMAFSFGSEVVLNNGRSPSAASYCDTIDFAASA
jgi:hypothetical protein